MPRELDYVSYNPNPLVENEPQKEYSFSEILGASARRNITGFEMLTRRPSESMSGVVDMNFNITDDKSQELFKQYNIEPLDFSDTEGVFSHYDLEQRLKEHDKRNNDAKIMNSLSFPTQLATEFGVGMLSPVDWLIGGVVGKTFQAGAKAMNVATKRGEQVTSALAGATGGIASVGALEASTSGDIDTINAVVAGTLGAGIGYFTGKGFVNNPDTLEPMTRLYQDGIDPSANNMKWYPQESDPISLLSPAHVRLKASENPAAREVGFKANHSMTGREVQDQTTIIDVKQKGNAQTSSLLKDIGSMIDSFKDKTVRAWDDATDGKAVLGFGHRVRWEYESAKDAEITRLKSSDINARVKAVEEEYNTAINTKVKELNDLAMQSQEVHAEGLDNALARAGVSESLSSIKKRQDALIKQLSDMKSNPPDSKLKKTIAEHNSKVNKLQREVDKLQKTIDDGVGYETKRQRIIDKAQESLNKSYEDIKKQPNAEIETLKKKKEQAIKEAQSYKHTPDELNAFRQQSIEAVSRNELPNIINKIPAEYRSFVEAINEKLHKYYGNRVNSTKLDGIDNLDTNFHWSRGYDIKKIVNNEQAAVQAFYRALAHNFKDIDEELASEIIQTANDIVNKLIRTNNIRDTFNVPNEITGKKLKKYAESGRLKTHTLKLNGAELIDFMDDSMSSYITSYHHDMNGRLAMKEVFGIDRQYDANMYANDKGIFGKDRDSIQDVFDSAMDKSMLDPKASSMSSKVLRSLRAANFLNFGGWFAPTTMVDLSNIVNDFGLSRTAKYITKDVYDGVFSGRDEGTRKFAYYFGLGGHSVMNDRAMLALGGEGTQINNALDNAISYTTSKFAKYTLLNATIDTMDRVAGLSAMDFIMNAKVDKFFEKNMNRFGLTLDDVSELRASSFVKFNDSGLISDVDFNKISDGMRTKVERAIRRAADDVVLKADEMDIPEWTKKMFSPAIAATIFQFMRFPIVAHNKIATKMYNNFNAVNATASAVTGISLLALISQARDVGKEKPRYDLDTKEGQQNFAKMVIEYTPALGSTALIQMQYDVIGRMIANANDSEYKGREDGINMGVSLERINQTARSLEDYMDGTANGYDASNLARWGSTNIFYINPFINMWHDTMIEQGGFLPNE